MNLCVYICTSKLEIHETLVPGCFGYAVFPVSCYYRVNNKKLQILIAADSCLAVYVIFNM